MHYPGAVLDPDTGALISDAEVAETTYTLTVRGHGRVTARLVVRRVKDARYPDALFPVWRYHPFFTNSDLPTAEADLTHRKHAIVETTFADLIDGPLAHIPSGLFAANCAWLACAVIAHNLLRAAGHPRRRHARRSPAAPPCAATWSTCPPASPRPPAGRRCTCPRTGHGRSGGKPCGTTSSATVRRSREQDERHLPAHPPSQARPRRHVESWCRPADHSCPHHSEPPQSCRNQPRDGTKSLIHGFRLSHQLIELGTRATSA